VQRGDAELGGLLDQEVRALGRWRRKAQGQPPLRSAALRASLHDADLRGGSVGNFHAPDDLLPPSREEPHEVAGPDAQHRRQVMALFRFERYDVAHAAVRADEEAAQLFRLRHDVARREAEGLKKRRYCGNPAPASQPPPRPAHAPRAGVQKLRVDTAAPTDTI